MRRRGNSVMETLVELGFGPERKCPKMADLEQTTGIAHQTIWLWLAGDKWPRLDQAMLLATALGVPLGRLANALNNAHKRFEKAEEVRSILQGN
jgi:transcriptional regulator with XRE-family HTH domain